MPASPEPIDIEIRRTDSLSARELDEIWAVTDRYVETTRTWYEAKLHALPEVGLWRTRGGLLVGLVSLDVYAVEWRGRTSTVFFTSSVVIDEHHRGRNLVLRTGLRAFVRETVRRPWRTSYWLFDTFSYKSYALLPHNLAEYWPRHGRVTPPRVAEFIDRLARERYGDHWTPATGVVTRSGHKRLRPATAPVDDRALADPDVRYFDATNPGHREGDMLVCLVPLTPWNLLGAIWRAVTRGGTRGLARPARGSV